MSMSRCKLMHFVENAQQVQAVLIVSWKRKTTFFAKSWFFLSLSGSQRSGNT